MQRHLHQPLKIFCRQYCRRRLYSAQAKVVDADTLNSLYKDLHELEPEFEKLLNEPLKATTSETPQSVHTESEPQASASTKRKDRAEAHLDVVLHPQEAKDPTLEDLDALKPTDIPKYTNINYHIFYSDLVERLSRTFSSPQLQQFCTELKVGYVYGRVKARKALLIDEILERHWGIESPQAIEKRLSMRTSINTSPSELFLLLGKDGTQLSKLSEKYGIRLAVHPNPLSIQLQGERDSIYSFLADIAKRREEISTEEVDLPTSTSLSPSLLQHLSRLTNVYIESKSGGKIKTYANEHCLLSKAKRLTTRTVVEIERTKNFPVIALVDPEARTTNPEIPSTVYALQPFLPEQTLSQPNGVLKNTFRCQRVNHWLDIEHSKSLLPEDRLLLENGNITSLAKLVNELLPGPAENRKITASLGHILIYTDTDEQQPQASILPPLLGKWNFLDFMKWLKEERGEKVQCVFSPSLPTTLLDAEPSQEKIVYRLKYRCTSSLTDPSQKPLGCKVSETALFEVDINGFNTQSINVSESLRDLEYMEDLDLETQVGEDIEISQEMAQEISSDSVSSEQPVAEDEVISSSTVPITEDELDTVIEAIDGDFSLDKEVTEEKSKAVDDELEFFDKRFIIPDISEIMCQKAKETDFLVALPDRPVDMKISVSDSIQQSSVSEFPDVEHYFKVLEQHGLIGLPNGFPAPPLSFHDSGKTFILESFNFCQQSSHQFENGVVNFDPIDKVIPGLIDFSSFQATLEKIKDLDSNLDTEHCSVSCDNIKDEESWKTFIQNLNRVTSLSFKTGRSVPDIPLEDGSEPILEDDL